MTAKQFLETKGIQFEADEFWGDIYLSEWNWKDVIQMMEMYAQHQIETTIDFEEDFEYDDESDDDEFYEDQEEREFEEQLNLAAGCKCGAWVIENGNVFHVADCCCGAE